jgi:CubicO group peptidase (beta-lactamase class C family)
MSSRVFTRRDVLKTALGAGLAGLAQPLAAVGAEVRHGSSGTPGLERVVHQMDDAIQRVLIHGQIPSIAVALIAEGVPVWSGGYGHSNLWSRTPAVASTVYFVGSIYKTVNAAAILQLAEQGKLSLDDPIRDHLPFPVKGETAAKPIRVRHLLTHTSGFGGNPPGVHHDIWGDTTPPALEEYLRDHARVERPPAEEVVYSNLAFTVAGYLVERISGVPFREYVERHLFAPSGMSNTAFIPSPHMRERLAVPYAPDDEGQLIPVPQLKSNHYPAGVVWSPVGDLARWVAVNLNGGAIGEARVLSEESIAEMHRPQFPQFRGRWRGFGIGEPARTAFGLGWMTGEQGDERLIAHSGSLNGYTSFAAGNLTRGFGIALMSNRMRAHSYLTALAEQALHLMAEHLDR